MIIATIVFFLVPGAILLFAWRGYLRKEETRVPPWRSYFGGLALSLASLATVLELIFLFSWFSNGGSPHGMDPAPGIWKHIGRVELWIFVAGIALTFFGKGRWRVLIPAWAASLCIVVLLLFMLDFD